MDARTQSTAQKTVNKTTSTDQHPKTVVDVLDATTQISLKEIQLMCHYLHPYFIN